MAPTVRGGFPRFGVEPVPWLAVGLVVGVAVVGPLVTCPAALWVGAVALMAVGALGGASRCSGVALVVAAVVWGGALGAPQAPSAVRDSVVQGEVLSVTGSSAVVDTPDGSVRLWFPDTVPAIGSTVSARTRPVAARPRLPGAPDGGLADRRTGRPTRRVVDHVVLGAEAPREEMPDSFAKTTHGTLLWTLATGRRHTLDTQLVDLLRRTGTAHLLSISGLHIGLVGALGWGLVGLLVRGGAWLHPAGRWPGRLLWVAAVAGVGAAVAYADLVGWPVSARRAVVMGVVVALARVSRRPSSPWSALGLAAIFVVCADPDAVAGLGFGLSFGAVVGILGVTPRVLRWLPPDLPWLVQKGAEGLAVSVGAMAGTLPLTAWWFQSVSPLSPVANLVAGPLVGGLAVPAALFAAHGPEVLHGVALGVGSTAVSVAVFALELVDIAPWAPAVGPAGAGCLGLALLVRRRTIWALGATVLALGTVRPAPSPTLEVTFLSVGQGDAVFVELPDGQRWLIDGGPPSNRVLEWLRREGHTHLDAVFLTHPDSDHLGGLEPVVNSLSIGRFITARPPRTDELTYGRVWRTLFQRGIPVDDVEADVGPVGQLLHPVEGWRTAAGATRRPRDNDDSLVLLLEHAGKRILLTGDIERPAEGWLEHSLPTVDVVQAPHHGSRSSSSDGLVVATDPEWVVMSCGVANRYGHPHPRTLAHWRGRKVVRTDVDGTLRIRVEPDALQVEHWSHDRGYQTVQPFQWRPRPP